MGGSVPVMERITLRPVGSVRVTASTDDPGDAPPAHECLARRWGIVGPAGVLPVVPSVAAAVPVHRIRREARPALVGGSPGAFRPDSAGGGFEL